MGSEGNRSGPEHRSPGLQQLSSIDAACSSVQSPLHWALARCLWGLCWVRARPGSHPPFLLAVEHEMLQVRLPAAALPQRAPRRKRAVLCRALALVAVPER